MSQAIIYYSYSGHTRELAKKKAEETGLPLIEIKQKKLPSKVKAYTSGCYAAMTLKSWPVLKPEQDLSQFSSVTVMGPVWAGFPAPPVTAVFEMLKEGTEVELVLASAGGKSAGPCKDNISAFLEDLGCKLISFEDVKGGPQEK